jgi:hypothetical protein
MSREHLLLSARPRRASNLVSRSWARARERLCRLGVVLQLVLASALLTSEVLADAPTQVVVITPDPAAPLALRVAAELRQLGLGVIFVRQPDTDTMGPTSLEATAQGVGAFAALRVVRSGPAVEVWIADRTTGKTVIREVVGEGQAGTDAEVALGAVELLRASLLELNAVEHPPQAQVEAAAPVLDIVPPPASPPASEPASGGRETSAALGAALDPGAGGYRVGYGPQVLVARRFGELVGLEAAGAVVYASIEDQPRASASTTVGWMGLAGIVAPSLGLVEPRIGVGLGAANLQVRGNDLSEGYFGRDLDSWLAVFHLRTGVAVQLYPTLRWRVDATLLTSATEVTIRFADERVASWGRPTLLGSTSLELVVR